MARPHFISLAYVVFWLHWPAQKHNCVQLRFAFLHLHLFCQLVLQPHFSSSRQPFDASGRHDHLGIQVWSTLVQPQSEGEGMCGLATNVWPHTWPAWNTARLTCSCRASSEGGMFWICLFPYANICLRASLTFVSPEVRWYMTKSDMWFMSSQREMTSQHIFHFNGMNVAKHWYVAGICHRSLIALFKNVLSLLE